MSLALYSPRTVGSSQLLEAGWCQDRRYRADCYCYKAKFCQNCQSCHQRINEDDCIERNSCGWTHVCCPGEERRGLPSIQAGFRRVRVDDIEEERPSVRRRLTYSQESNTDESVSSSRTNSRDEIKIDENSEGSEEESQGESEQRAEAETCDSAAVVKSIITNQQQKILDHVPEFGGLPVCVNALAGCGKTTTIALLCNHLQAKYRDSVILYLVFNAKNQNEAMESGKFPKTNMEIRTTHAFVLRHYFGTDHMMSFSPQDDYTLEDIIETVRLRDTIISLFPNENPNSRKLKRKINSVASYIRKTLHNFQASESRHLDENHIFWRARKNTELSERSKWRNKIPTKKYKEWASEFFNVVVDRCHAVKDHGSNVTGISHDGYLKVAQLEVDLTNDFKFVIVDEAQDFTPCQADLFWGDPVVRRNRAIYLFGDKYQQLYRFRGASRSFAEMHDESSTKFTLTGSFRFGPKIADVATRVLQSMGGETLIGRAADPGHVHDKDGFDNRGVALCRTNLGIYSYLFFNRPRRWTHLSGSKDACPKPPKWVYHLEKFVRNLKEEEVGAPPSLEGDEPSDDKSVEGDNVFTYRGEKFTSFHDIDGYIVDEGDTELLKYLNLLLFLKEQNETLDVFIDSIRQSFVPLSGDPDMFDGVVLGTVHKAKGLEFSRVLLHDDYKFKVILSSVLNEERHSDETNILYVAITRAREHLFLSWDVRDCLNKISEALGRGEIGVQQCLSMADMRAKLEVLWSIFESKREAINCVSDIPWPSDDTSNPLSLDPNMSEAEQRQYFRILILRYHPDKFFPKFGSLMGGHVENCIRNRITELMSHCYAAMRELQNPDEST